MANAVDGPPDDGVIRLPRTDSAMNKIAPALDQKPKEKKAKKETSESDAKILHRARKRFDRCHSHDETNRKNALKSLKFVNNEQWDDGDMKAREGRPTITSNHMRTLVNQVANSQRENRPAIQISPDGDTADVQVAKLLKGVIRKIESDCNADIAYDTGFWNAGAAGWGWWRVTTDYESPDSFDQVLEVQSVPNIFTVYTDPQSKQPDNADSRFNFVTEMIDRDDFKDQFPGADPINFEGVNMGDAYKNWLNEKQVRVAEYFEIKHEKQTLLALSNGWVGTKDELDDGVQAQIDAGRLEIENQREVERPFVKWYKITAKEILDRKDWPGKWIPLVKVVGNEVNIEGKTLYTAAIGDAIDMQRMLNYWLSLQTELLAMQPKSPWVIAEGQIEGYEDDWHQANVRSMSVLTYKPETLEGQLLPPPQRQPLTGVPAGIVEARTTSSQEIMATTGIRFDATLHERLNDESGKALREIRRATDIGTYHFIDNLSRSLKHTGRILIDLIPKVYDTKRILAIAGEDGKEQQVMLDPHQAKPLEDKPHPKKPGQKLTSINPTLGKYSCTVTIGPDSATKRIEAVESLMQLVKAIPQMGPMSMDLIVKNLDGPEMDVLAARLAKGIPPHLHDQPNMKHLPPEVQGLIGSQQMQLQQLQQQHMLALKALNDKAIAQELAQDKIDKDFEAKILAVIQKAQASQDKSVGDKVQGLADQVSAFMDALTQHSQALQQGGQNATA